MVVRFQVPHLSVKSVRLFLALAGALSVQAGPQIARPAHAQPLPDRTAFSGRITDADGLPVGGASVTLRRQDSVGATGYWGNVTFTDARGEFSFPDAETGDFVLNIEASGFAPVYNRTVTIGTTAAGQTIKLVPLARVTFVAAAADDHNLAKQPISLLLRPSKPIDGVGARIVRGQTNDNGEVEFNDIVPGEYDTLIVARGQGYAQLNNLTFTSGKTSAPVAVKFQPGGSMRIVARSEDANRPLGGTQVIFLRITETSPDAPMGGPGMEMILYRENSSDFVTRDVTGEVVVDDLVPGKYRVEVNLGNGQPNASQTVDVTSGQVSEATIKSQIGPRSTLDVQVNGKDGQPVANTLVTLLLQQEVQPAKSAISPAAEQAPRIIREVRSLTTDASGKGSLYPLAQGHWKIVIRRGTDGNLSDAKETDLTLEGGSVTLTVPN